MEERLLLPGVPLAALWLITFLLAMAESALTYASRYKLEETIERPQTPDRDLRRPDRPGVPQLAAVSTL